MPWSERQQAMLAAMGLQLWTPPSPLLPPPPPRTTQAAVTAEAQHPVASAATEATAPAISAVIPAAVRAPIPAAAPTLPRTERQALIATLGWSVLRDTVAVCQACGLHQSRTQTVFGVGHRQAHWMVVGEAPGEQEDRVGEPFVGPAGQLLDRMLAALRLTRAEDGDVPAAQRVYIVNTLKCRPPRNRNPAPQEMAECEPYLMRQIALVQPRIILAMGAFAIKALLRTDQPVGKLRGQVHRYQGVPLVVTYHPAYLLRSLQEKAKAWDDLCLAASVVDSAA